MTGFWDDEQADLERRAAALREQLGIDAALARIGSATLVGSAALHVMVARDIDLTVAVRSLGPAVIQGVTDLAARLSQRADVREVTFRNDTGRWNVDPGYPDGLYLRIECHDDRDELWTVDIWFVDAPERQPDLEHLTTIGPRITPESQAAILAIKRAVGGVRRDGTRLASLDIYRAVLDEGARTPEDFDRLR